MIPASIIEQLNAYPDNNVYLADTFINAYLKQLLKRSSFDFVEDRIQAIASLMQARAAYKMSIYEEDE